MENKRKVFDTVDIDDKPLKLAVVRPTNKISQEANMAYNLKMAELIRRGSQNDSHRLLLRSELEEYLAKMGVWTLRDSVEVEKLALEIRACEVILKKGGIKVSEGRKLALQMAEKRQMILNRHSNRLQFDATTIESQAENFRFEFLLIRCLIYADTGSNFLRNHTDYIERQDEIAIMDGAKSLANMIYGLDDNITKNMFEMRWLKDAGMIDEDGRYTLSDGSFVDNRGRLVNGDGQYINTDGHVVDIFNRQVDENGNPLITNSKPFIDDETGEPIIIGDIGAKKTKSKKKKRKKATVKSKS